MDQAEAACHSNAVSTEVEALYAFRSSKVCSVLNVFKSMVTDDDLLEKEDMYILDRMKEFAVIPDVHSFAAAKQLVILIERAVCCSLFSALLSLIIFCSNIMETVLSRPPIRWESPLQCRSSLRLHRRS